MAEAKKGSATFPATSARTIVIEPAARTSFLEMFALGGSPVIRPLLIIQVPNANNKGAWLLFFARSISSRCVFKRPSPKPLPSRSL